MILISGLEDFVIMGISVAMCTYNAKSYLREQLKSIADQSVAPLELVVCDDCSVDGTQAILEEFAKQSSFPTRIVRNPVNLGYKRNFVKAVGLCTGGIIALCDQDDVWYPQKLARTEAVFRTNLDADGFFSDGDLIGEDSVTLGRSLWESFSFDLKDQALFNSGGAVDQLLRRNVVTGMTFAFRSDVKDLLCALPDSWIHDGWLAFLIAARSKLIACPERLVGYRLHGGQQVGTSLSFREKIQRVLKKGAKVYLQEMHRRNLDEYERLATQFGNLEHFFAVQPGSVHEELIAKIRAKADHARMGAVALSSRRLGRWKIIAEQASSYSRFSPTGLRAIPRDLFV